jgi:protein-tyrosine phosphatase
LPGFLDGLGRPSYEKCNVLHLKTEEPLFGSLQPRTLIQGNVSLPAMDAEPLPAFRLDLHCHLLPGVDDGCQTVEQSLECVRRWRAAGYLGSVCTPHMGSEWYPENTPPRVAEGVKALQRRIDGAGLEYRLWAGGEVRLSETVTAWLREWGVPTLGESRWALVDYFGREWPPFCDRGIDYLLDHGYEVLLAHPERLGLPERQWHEVMESLAARGVHFQGNLNCVSGGEGPVAQDRALRWLHEGRYWVLASDTHGPDSVPGRLLGAKTAEHQIGAEPAAELLSTRPRAMLEVK